MIRINLLGQARPKAARGATSATTSLALILILGLAFGATVLGVMYFQKKQQLDVVRVKIDDLRAQKAALEHLQEEVRKSEQDKAILDQRYAIIEELQRNRTGGQELLTMVANSVTRTDSLWLTSVVRRGNVLTIEGAAGSVNAVANLITQMKRSGYFQQVEVREAKQDERVPEIQTFNFTLTANFVLPTAAPAAAPGRS